MYPYVIIEDNPSAVENLKGFMAHFPEYQCVGVATEYKDALLCILETKPRLVFLDIKIHGMKEQEETSFPIIAELRQYLSSLPYFIMFTAYKKYAIQAIKNEALDYLLKPVDPLELKIALLKFEQKIRIETQGKDKDFILCIKSHGDYRFIDCRDILYLQADDNSTDFHLISGSKISGFRAMKYYLEELPDSFVRIHNSYAVNSGFVTRIHFGKSQCFLNHLLQPLPFSKSYKTAIERIKNTLIRN
ncbi:LytTR family DNA-binding domain-containing protein [Chryseobacterium sp. EO14]|uniref:LytR/AlgR family response regulator transcription factor n=1 Tax=Chryseobacterium sp. EO14 TaxID=2950551 RepID=UPI00210D8016|nr:LytTR family DNA-binding domain-containing protein [Chryseobacterium sp. EO14]MCQ4141615.1 LytTR family DNA-binding domain-containing protein [Chryseobacterium sp. EO14]